MDNISIKCTKSFNELLIGLTITYTSHKRSILFINNNFKSSVTIKLVN